MIALAEGLGFRAVARVFETDPNTILNWLVEAAEHLEAFSRYHLRDLYAEHIQMDEPFALLSAVKEGEMTEAQGHHLKPLLYKGLPVLLGMTRNLRCPPEWVH